MLIWKTTVYVRVICAQIFQSNIFSKKKKQQKREDVFVIKNNDFVVSVSLQVAKQCINHHPLRPSVCLSGHPSIRPPYELFLKKCDELQKYLKASDVLTMIHPTPTHVTITTICRTTRMR